MGGRSKEELINYILTYIEREETVPKDDIIEWLTANYSSDEGFPEGFDKIHEMTRVLDLIEEIKLGADIKIATLDSTKAVIYSIAVIEGKKHKLDISRVHDDFEIDNLFNKYLTKEN